jgi:putrescine transport system substrate-binding protein
MFTPLLRGALVAMSSLALFCACGRGGGAAAENVVNVYSWADYIAPDTIPNFEKETGIKVQYATFDNNEVLETRLLTGHSNFDAVVPTGMFFQRQREAGVYRKLDKSMLPNLKNLDPEFMARLAKHDPGNLYAVPYLWGSTGLGYNLDAVRARLGGDPPDSWALLFDPQHAAKLKDCGIAIVDSPLDVIFSAILYLGRDPQKLDPGDLAAAGEVLRRIRPYIRYIDPAQHINDLAGGSICLSLAWSGDFNLARSRAREARNGVKVVYLVPREGAMISLDMIGIPADAPHPHNALVWLNYLMRPDVIAGVTNYIKYPNANAAALPLVDPAIRNDPSIYPPEAVRARFITSIPATPEYTRLANREWTTFRTGN